MSMRLIAMTLMILSAHDFIRKLRGEMCADDLCASWRRVRQIVQ
jgi:hypothetical protein